VHPNQQFTLQVEQFFESLQTNICRTLEAVDGTAHFQEDAWRHPDGGGGKTRVLNNGKVFEKAGVNFSAVKTQLSEKLAARLKVQPQPAFATGISLVLHPESPMIPTVHMNLRYFELANGDAWFGGGADLTPYYLFEEDARHFHHVQKNVCDAFDPSCYPRFKASCDEYFFLKHRNETRGIGGIFFDYEREQREQFFEFVQNAGNAFLEAYRPIVDRRKNEPFGKREREWQLIRRGRYVEFNLLYDRGTLFGLETGGRTESILISLPPEVKWAYNHEPEPGSREASLLEVLRKPRAWA